MSPPPRTRIRLTDDGPAATMKLMSRALSLNPWMGDFVCSFYAVPSGGRVWVRRRMPDPLACTSFPLGSSGWA